jgi:hypothetical protein
MAHEFSSNEWAEALTDSSKDGLSDRDFVIAMIRRQAEDQKGHAVATWADERLVESAVRLLAEGGSTARIPADFNKSLSGVRAVVRDAAAERVAETKAMLGSLSTLAKQLDRDTAWLRKMPAAVSLTPLDTRTIEMAMSGIRTLNELSNRNLLQIDPAIARITNSFVGRYTQSVARSTVPAGPGIVTATHDGAQGPVHGEAGTPSDAAVLGDGELAQSRSPANDAALLVSAAEALLVASQRVTAPLTAGLPRLDERELALLGGLVDADSRASADGREDRFALIVLNQGLVLRHPYLAPEYRTPSQRAIDRLRDAGAFVVRSPVGGRGYSFDLAPDAPDLLERLRAAAGEPTPLAVAQARADIAEHRLDDLEAGRSKAARRREELRRNAAVREFRVARAVILIVAVALFAVALLAPDDIADPALRNLIRVVLLVAGVLGASSSIGDISVWRLTGWLQQHYVSWRASHLERLFDVRDDDST